MMIALSGEFKTLVPRPTAYLESLLECFLSFQLVFLDARSFQVDFPHFQAEVTLLLLSDHHHSWLSHGAVECKESAIAA